MAVGSWYEVLVVVFVPGSTMLVRVKGGAPIVVESPLLRFPMLTPVLRSMLTPFLGSKFVLRSCLL